MSGSRGFHHLLELADGFFEQPHLLVRDPQVVMGFDVFDFLNFAQFLLELLEHLGQDARLAFRDPGRRGGCGGRRRRGSRRGRLGRLGGRGSGCGRFGGRRRRLLQGLVEVGGHVGEKLVGAHGGAGGRSRCRRLLLERDLVGYPFLGRRRFRSRGLCRGGLRGR